MEAAIAKTMRETRQRFKGDETASAGCDWGLVLIIGLGSLLARLDAVERGVLLGVEAVLKLMAVDSGRELRFWVAVR